VSVSRPVSIRPYLGAKRVVVERAESVRLGTYWRATVYGEAYSYLGGTVAQTEEEIETWCSLWIPSTPRERKES